MKNELNYSPVVFEEGPHTYTYGEKKLSGITGILHKYLFSEMYSNVNEEVLERARVHGTLVHEQISDLIVGLPSNELLPEVEAYSRLGIEALESEFTVSDLENVASNIDIVGADYTLYDIKTTYTLNKEYLMWQLSIYAYLFEKQNPHLKVPALYAIHLKGDKARLVPINRLPDENVIALINAFSEGAETFTSPMQMSADLILDQDDDTIARICQLETEIAKYKTELDARKSEYESLKEGLLPTMKRVFPAGGTYTFPNGLKVIYSTATQRTDFDKSRLEAEKPDIYAQYIKMTDVKESLKITVPKEKKTKKL